MSAESLRRILVPVDFSEPSRAAMDWAFTYALSVPSRIQLLHVIDHVATAQTEARKAEREAIATTAKTELERITPTPEDRARIGHIDRGWVWGKPGEQICRMAAEEGSTLIVMGTHGRKGWRRATAGSVAEYVLRNAPCTVVCVKASVPPD